MADTFITGHEGKIGKGAGVPAGVQGTDGNQRERNDAHVLVARESGFR